MKLLDLLRRMFGKDYLNSIIGTRTNISKPIKLDKNSPFKEYSDSAFDDPKVLDYIEEKLMEYGPYVLSNKNMVEVQKFIKNAERYIQARNKQAGVTEGMKSAKEPKPKPEAEVFDIGTKQKVKPQGIETLKSEVGLPKGVEPGSLADRAIQESAQYKMNQQGVKSLLDENYKAPKTTTIDEDEAFEFEKFEKDPRRPGGPLDPAVGITRAGARLILENKGIKIGSKDPLDLVRENFGQDFLNEINNISEEMLEIDRRGGSYRDLTDLLKREGLYDAPINKDAPKGYSPEEMQKMIDEVEATKSVAKQIEGVTLKGGETLSEIQYIKKFKKHPRDTITLPRRPGDYDDLPVDEQRSFDIEEEEIYKNAVEEAIEDDIPDMAEGGRIGFASGTGLKALLAMMGKGAKTADEVEQPASSKLKKMFDDFNKRNRQLTDEDIQDYELELGDAETWYESGMTVADAEKLVADRKAYEAQMLVDYKAGRLDPKRGEPGRREYLERKLQEAEMSGDSRLIDPDELDELTEIEFRERTMNAKGGLNYLMGL